MVFFVSSWLIFLLFLFRAPAAGKGQARGGGPPYHLPETALSSLLFAPASRPPSLFLHLLLPHLAPSGVPLLVGKMGD